MAGQTIIRRLGEVDAEAYLDLRRRALADAPMALTASVHDDFITGQTLVAEMRRAPDWVIFGAFHPDGLAGAVGLMRERPGKRSHIAQLWGMWVAPEHRRSGLAAVLVRAAIAHARTMTGLSQLQLSVSSAAPGAKRVYQRAGFVSWGIEPDALRHEGHSASEEHMWLQLS